MAVATQEVNDRYAIYNGDCVEVMASIPDASVHESIYSPPFCGLYNYSSSEHDMSNCRSYDEFFMHYEFLVRQIHRASMPGRMTAVHCMDVPNNHGGLDDLPGDIIRLHKSIGFDFHARFSIWKEPLRVAIRTRSKGLTHRQLVKDSSWSNNAGADYLLVFRKGGENKVPIIHPHGLDKYVGEREVPGQFTTPDGKTYPKEAFYAWTDPQTNKLAHWGNAR